MSWSAAIISSRVSFIGLGNIWPEALKTFASIDPFVDAVDGEGAV